MIDIGEIIQCWNCGREYDPEEHDETCPSCGEYPGNNPDSDIEEVEDEDEDYYGIEDDLQVP